MRRGGAEGTLDLMGKWNGPARAEASSSLRLCSAKVRNKKADVVAHPEAFHHVGLLVAGPPSTGGLPLAQSPDISTPHCTAKEGKGK